MRLQMALWIIMLINLLLLEGPIRLSGGSGSLVAGSPYEGTALLSVLFVLHIVPAVATYLLWSGLVIVSYRRRGTPFLGSFSPRHKVVGKIVLGGLLWTAISACFVYCVTFWA